jgi:LysW-gamma-L-alpha-aminoadipyl-6-phosphate/LysW-L-glutamyl-5-phosphate reductase
MTQDAALQIDQEQQTSAGPGARTVAIMGGSGYVGGELLRYLSLHPGFEVVAASSRKLAGEPVHRVHPHLRGFLDLRFTTPQELPDADVVLTCLPHGHAATAVRDLLEQGTRVVDLSADLRLRDPEVYREWYGKEHPAPELLSKRVYGLPEAHREELRSARVVSGVGCVATSVNLALLPLARAGLLREARVVADAKIGSSAAGSEPSAAGLHAERSRTIRLYAPTSHRHAAEVQQETGLDTLHMSVHAVELVRGALATCHVLLPGDAPSTRELWQAWRASYSQEPFVRMVKERKGVHRGPDPRLVAGTNLADVGFHVEEGTGRDPGRIVATCAIDNLGKGAAGSAVQSLNLMMGYDETQGLMMVPAHPA